MCKLNTRKFKGTRKPPSYKIWALSLTINKTEQTNFVWCERGNPAVLHSYYQQFSNGMMLFHQTELITPAVIVEQPCQLSMISDYPEEDELDLLLSYEIPDLSDVISNDTALLEFLALAPNL
jgi:hypothetical protein